MMCRWAQELLGYHFSILHRLGRMMIDVDGLSRRLGPIIAHHLCVAALFHQIDVANRPLAYTWNLANAPADTKNAQSNDARSIPISILTSSLISSISTPTINESAIEMAHLCASTPRIIPNVYLHSVPVLLTKAPYGCINTYIEVFTWVCVNDILGTFLSWSIYGNSGSVN